MGVGRIKKIKAESKGMMRAYCCSFFLLLSSYLSSMDLGDVTTAINQAASRAVDLNVTTCVIAVVDREGYVLGVWDVGSNSTPELIATAVSKAGTAAFLSSNQHAFTSRTGGFLIQGHFPPGVNNRPPGPLIGLGSSSLPFSDINRFRTVGNVAVVGSSIAGNPGGVPLYKNGILLGGIGVTLDGSRALQVRQVATDDERIALAGQIGFEPSRDILATGVAIDGISLPYVNSETVQGVSAVIGMPAVLLAASLPAVVYGSLSGFDGEIRSSIIADPLGGQINGQDRLTAPEVETIIRACATKANQTRAGIRLPRGKTAKMYISVLNNPNTPGTAPAVLGTFYMTDATMFSWDISVQKGRTVLFFSDNTRAYSARTIGFLAQSTFPPGIDNTTPGLFFGLQEEFSDPLAINPNLPNGMTLFPGGFPLYRNGELIGAISVSGDGVDQDDYIAAAGAALFPPPPAIRADQKMYRGTRLPYAKFPRNPEQL